jgi:hypothetical protein
LADNCLLIYYNIIFTVYVYPRNFYRELKVEDLK